MIEERLKESIKLDAKVKH